jgi:hypothetical protein
MPFPTSPIFLPAPVQAEADPAVTDRNVAHFQDEGRSLLLSVARPLRLADALRQRRLAPEQGRRLLHGVVAAVRPVVLSVTDALIAGSFRLAGWFRSMRDALVPGYFAGALAVLDDPDPPPADVSAIVAEANRQVGYLGRFRDQVATAVQLLDGTARARAEMYAEAVWSSAMKVQLAEKSRDGMREGMRHLGAADHCAGCLSEAAKGWMPLDQVTQIGDTICRTRCHCWLSYR